MFHVEQLIRKIKFVCKSTPDLVLFYFLVLIIPFGSRRFLITFVPYSNLVFNEWSSAFIYLTDIVAMLVIIFWLRRIISFHLEFRKKGRLLGILTVLFCLLALISAFLSPFWTLGVYGALRLVLYCLIFLYTFYNIVTFRRRLSIAVTLFVSGGLQSILGMWQFINQRSFGLTWLGESVLSTDLENVAEIIHGGVPILRAYGTFPHPNALAYFLLVSFAFGIYTWIKIANKYYRLAASFVLGLIFAVFLLTFSRVAWLSAAIAIFISVSIFAFFSIKNFFHQKKIKLRRRHDQFSTLILPILLFFVMIIGSFIVLSPLVSSRLVATDSNGDMAVSMREFLTEKAILYGQQKPVLGWGSRSFVPLLAAREGTRLPAWMMQPIHNSWVGLLFEIGFPGLVVFATIVIVRLSLLFKSKNVPRGTFLPSNDILYVSIIAGLIVTACFLMLFDHYILDVHQASLTFWILLGL